MKQLVLTLAVAALVVPATALGKGPEAASISGPGGGGSGGELTFTGCCAPETSTMRLAEQAGFFPAVFPQQPNRMRTSRPKGELGPKYTITYTVPGPNNETWKIHQDLYPYASPGPVTYMKPGQTVFHIAGGTRGGWFQADSRLKKTLVAAGLPPTASGGSSDGNQVPTFALGGAGVLAFVLVSALVMRRRMRPTARMAGSPS